MDSSTSPNEHANVQRQESPMSVQEQPIVGLNGNGTTATVAETMTSSGVATLMPDSGSDEVAATILTPEQEEERKLRLKYPNPQKPGGSTFIQKMLLHKGCKKYFDSGDYNMAKSRTKAHVTSNGANGTTTQAPPMPNSGCLVAPQRISEELSTPNTSTNFSPNLSQSQNSTQSRLSTSPQTNTSSLNSSTAVQPSTTPQIDGVSTPSTTSSNSSHHYHNHHSHNHQYNQQQTPSLHSRLSSTNINNSSPLVLFPSSSSSSSSSSSTTSTSTSSLHQSGGQQAARQLLSSSTSASNIMGSAAAMQVDPVLLNAADEIGHGIPTPECLPQSRKHAISQSKLATPRLSTS